MVYHSMYVQVFQVGQAQPRRFDATQVNLGIFTLLLQVYNVLCGIHIFLCLLLTSKCVLVDSHRHCPKETWQCLLALLVQIVGVIICDSGGENTRCVT